MIEVLGLQIIQSTQVDTIYIIWLYILKVNLEVNVILFGKIIKYV